MKLLAFFVLATVSFAVKDEEAMFNMRQEWCGEQNCYDVLGVSATAENSAIKDAYKQLSKDLHPDKCKDCDPAQMTRVNQAYQILSNAKNRDMYDRVLKVKRSVDAPKENTLLVCLLVFGLTTFVVHQYQMAQFKEVKKQAVHIPKVKRELMTKCPNAYPKQMDKKARRKAAKAGPIDEPDPVALVPNDVLDQVLTALNESVNGWTGEEPTPQSAAIDVLKFPLTFAIWALTNVTWVVKYTLLKQEYSRNDKLTLLCAKHNLDRDAFDSMSWSKKKKYLASPGPWTDLYDEIEAESK